MESRTGDMSKVDGGEKDKEVKNGGIQLRNVCSWELHMKEESLAKKCKDHFVLIEKGLKIDRERTVALLTSP